MKIEEISKQQAEVEIINSIKTKYKKLRSKSKSPTFAMTYAGSVNTLKKKFNFSDEDAINIYTAYHNLYKQSDEWVNQHIDFACKHGYVEGAFGLRIRCYKLHQVTLGTKSTPTEAEAEKRTVGNFLGQSWCLLNTRAGIAFNRRVRDSEYKLDILPIGQIHDAQYFVIKDDPDVLLWVNKYLVEEARWQEHPAIKHPLVHLGGELSVFIPTWSEEMVIPNECNSKEELDKIADEFFME